MRDHLLPTGRVRYFPMSDYADGTASSRVTGETTEISARTRIVDTTHLKTTVPSTHTPSYRVDPTACASCLSTTCRRSTAPRGLGHRRRRQDGHGRRALADRNGADPDSITWIMPRDGWFIPREARSRRPEFAATCSARRRPSSRPAPPRTSIDDLFDRLEAGGVLVRLDENREARDVPRADRDRRRNSRPCAP